MKTEAQPLHQGAEEERARGLEPALDMLHEDHYLSWMRIRNYLSIRGAPLTLIFWGKETAGSQRLQEDLVNPRPFPVTMTARHSPSIKRRFPPRDCKRKKRGAEAVEKEELWSWCGALGKTTDLTK